MNKSDYIIAINNIKASDELKNNIKHCLLSKDYKSNYKRYTYRRCIHVRKIIIVSAVFLLFLISTATFVYKSVNKDENVNLVQKDYSNLPILEISNPQTGGMGFSIVEANNVKDLLKNSVWNPSIKINELPVFYNSVYLEEGCYQVGVYDGIKYKEMLEKTKSIAKILNEEILSVKIDVINFMLNDNLGFSGGLSFYDIDVTDNNINLDEDGNIYLLPDIILKEKNTANINDEYIMYDKEKYNRESYVYKLSVISENYIISIDSSNQILLNLKVSKELPYKVNVHEKMSFKKIQKLSQKLIEEYGEITNFNINNVCFSANFNDFYDNSMSLEVYDKANTIEEKLINKNFNCIEFSIQENMLYPYICFRDYELNDNKIGDYPIISIDEAVELVLKGKCWTTVPELSEKNMDKNVLKKSADLVYLTRPMGKYYIPYYKFYVELLSDSKDDDKKYYGIFYVTAVKEEYLINFSDFSPKYK